ncbi:Phosphatidylinositol 4-kinase pik1alpha (PI4-kinase)(PtdIns-4-kinase) [Paramarasmius palmivorus]|uniref:1-phosphatidylinositol 4-kinase n=1 Tax=Paramarasmius palmivorus TaxID=297713 RepID=A0AAW0DSM1_9AGAR
MQAALKDLPSVHHESVSFSICQRVLHKCHEIIFGDLPPAASPYATLNLPFRSRFSRKKVKHNAEPAIIGIGMVLAGTPALPRLTEIMGEVAIEQGRAEEGTEIRSIESQADDLATGSPGGIDEAQEDEETDPKSAEDGQGCLARSPRPTSTPNEASQYNRAFANCSRTSATSPKYPPFSQLEDPLGNLIMSPFITTPYQSSPSIPSARPSIARMSSQNYADNLLQTYDLQSSDSPIEEIVRIPPGESVVLNSAERHPISSTLRWFSDDLDFDPQKRSNKDVLKKIVVREEEHKGTSRDTNPFSTFVPTPLQQSRNADAVNDVDVTIEDRPTSIDKTLVITPATPSTGSLILADFEEEEMDLVEQLYGPDQSLRSQPIDLSESIVLPPAPKNKDLDMAAWSRPSSMPSTPNVDLEGSNGRLTPSIPESARSSPAPQHDSPNPIYHETISLDEYSERMRTAAIMLAQLNANLSRDPTLASPEAQSSGALSWIPGSSWLISSNDPSKYSSPNPSGSQDLGKPMASRMRLQPAEAAAIRDRIMQEMLALEEERMARMKETRDGENSIRVGDMSGGLKTAEDESIIRKELSKADPSAMSRIRHGSPYGHLANWDCVSVIVKLEGDLRQEQLAVQLIREFQQIWEEESCQCWVRHFRILITGGSSGLVETITDAVSIHSIKKAEYARRLTEGRLGHVTYLTTLKTHTETRPLPNLLVLDGILRSYSVVTYLLQIKDRHNGNILLDRDGHLIHIDFGFMLSNTPGNIRFEAAPFKLPPEYVEVLGGVDSASFLEFKQLFREGFEAARKHCDRIITLVELMQKDSTLPCFAAFGEQTAAQLRDRFQPALTHSLVGDLVDRLIYSSLGSHWTRLYDSYQYYSQSIL